MVRQKEQLLDIVDRMGIKENDKTPWTLLPSTHPTSPPKVGRGVLNVRIPSVLSAHSVHTQSTHRIGDPEDARPRTSTCVTIFRLPTGSNSE